MISRRAFLKTLGWGAAGLTLVAGGAWLFAPRPVLPSMAWPSDGDACLWLSLRPDGTVALASPTADMGQGASIAYRQIVAEETGLPLDRVTVIQPRTDLLAPTRATVGSETLMTIGPHLARAAAAFAALLKREAAARLGERAEAIALGPEGARGASGAVVPLTELAQRPLVVDATEIAQARAVSFSGKDKRRLVGTSPQPEALRAIVTGSAPLYVDDVRLPGMIFVAALRPPSVHADLRGFDDSGARGIAGYVGARSQGRIVYAAAESRHALAQAVLAIRPEWTADADLANADSDNDGLERLLPAPEGSAARHLADDTLEEGPFDVDLTLTVPMAAHAGIEPRCAVAEWRGDKLTVHTSTQDATFAQRALMAEFGLSAADCVVIGYRLGGAFGARFFPSVEPEAARAARLFERPVKLQWSRRDEFRAGYARPPSVHRIRARLDAEGEISDWHHAVRSAPVVFSSAGFGPAMQWITDFFPDFGVSRNAEPPYRISRRAISYESRRIPVPTGPWRGLGAAPNGWAIETAIDALARHAGLDPLAFRLANLPDTAGRQRRVLETVADMSGWRQRPSGDGENRGDSEKLGIACGSYKGASFVAVVARVERAADSDARVTRLWCAQDCGLVVNPSMVRAQIEGNLVFGIGMALIERLRANGGAFEANHFVDYPIPRMKDVPPMEIALVGLDETAAGTGETAIVAATAAVTNAVAALTGETVTSLPFRGRASQTI